MALTFTTVFGADFERWTDPVARLRIQVFREFPYLYDGDLDYERRYLEHYQQTAGSVLVLALDQQQVVGAATALPMVDADAAFQAPFVDHGRDPGQIYYFGESVLLPDYRGQGAGHRFFDERERAARDQGFATTAFCAVVRPEDHPARPADYRPLDDFWRKRGYRSYPELRCSFPWRDPGADRDTAKTMQFWLQEW